MIALVVLAGAWALSGQPLPVAVFGLTCAFAAPIGLSSIGFAGTGGRDGLVTRLARVPEIDRLIAKADSEAERLRILGDARRELDRFVELEVHQAVLNE